MARTGTDNQSELPALKVRGGGLDTREHHRFQEKRVHGIEVTSSGALGSWAQISPGPTAARAGTWRTTSAAPSLGRSCRCNSQYKRSSTGEGTAVGPADPEFCREIMEQRKARSWQRALDPMRPSLRATSQASPREQSHREKSRRRVHSVTVGPRSAQSALQDRQQPRQRGRAARSAGSAR